MDMVFLNTSKLQFILYSFKDRNQLWEFQSVKILPYIICKHMGSSNHSYFGRILNVFWALSSKAVLFLSKNAHWLGILFPPHPKSISRETKNMHLTLERDECDYLNRDHKQNPDKEEPISTCSPFSNIETSKKLNTSSCQLTLESLQEESSIQALVRTRRNRPVVLQ